MKNNVRSYLRNKFFPEQAMTEEDYTRGRRLFLVEGAATQGINSMTTGVIISGFLKFLGVTDVINGIISGIPVCAGILQLFSPVVFRRMKREKLVVTLLALFHRLLYAAMLSVPLFISDTAGRMAMFIALFSCGQIIGFFIMPSTSNWMVNLVPDKIRGRFLGIKEGVSLLTMGAVSISMALVIDHMKLMGQEMWGYAICSVTILTLTIVDFLCFFHAGEPPSPLGQKKVSLKTMLTVPFQDKAFRKVIGLSILFNFGMQVGGPYFGVYFYSVLGLDYTYIMLVNIVFYLVRTTAAQIWGRVADKKSWAFISKCSLAWLGIVHAAFMLLNGGNMYYMFPALQVIAGVGWGGVAISMFNMQFEYAPRENRTVYIAANAAVSSVSGFSAVLVGSLIVNLVGGKVWQIFNVPVVGMQRLFILSGSLLVLTALYIHKVIQPRSKLDIAE